MKKRLSDTQISSVGVSEEDIEAVGRVIHSLERMISTPAPSRADKPSTQHLIKMVKRIRAARRARVDFFDASLFGEPAWDMLLGLYLASAEQYRLTISNLVHESEATATTALRWITRFEQLSLVVRRQNPFDNRSHFVELSPEALEKLTILLETMWVKQFPFD
jgi:DNA-binding MarR family transcriptional regulator